MRSSVGRIVGVAILVIGSGAFAQETTTTAPEAMMTSRSFDRFEVDAETARGLWAELGGAVSHDLQRPLGQKAETVSTTAFLRAAYGGDYYEAGVTVPFYRGLDTYLNEQRTSGEDAFGDISFFGKAMPLRSEYVDAGAGLVLTVPSGDKDKGLGTGEVEMIPFATVALKYGSLAVRGHGGFQFPSDSTPVAREASVYGGGIFWSLSDRIAFRSELNGATFSSPGKDLELLAWQPGFDIVFPYDSFNLFVRPTGSYGLTTETFDWGFGGSFVVALKP